MKFACNAASAATTVLALLTALWSNATLAAPRIIAEIEPFKRVTLSAEVTGIVHEIPLELGQAVTKGQSLASFDRSDYALNEAMAEARVKLSEAELKASERQYKRLQKLYRANNLSISQLEEQQRQYEVNKAQVHVDQINHKLALQTLDKTIIKAPFGGIVANRIAETGQMLNPGDPVLELVALNRVKAVFYLLEMDYMQLGIVAPITLEIEALQGRSYNAQINHISPVEDGVKPGYRVEVLLDNSDLALKPGFTARVLLPEQDSIPEQTASSQGAP
mgnify:FL=1